MNLSTVRLILPVVFCKVLSHFKCSVRYRVVNFRILSQFVRFTIIEIMKENKRKRENGDGDLEIRNEAPTKQRPTIIDLTIDEDEDADGDGDAGRKVEENSSGELISF